MPHPNRITLLLPEVFRKFRTNILSKLKRQFQVIFGQNFFPLNINPFQASLLQDSTNYCLLTNRWWKSSFSHYNFCAKVSLSSCKGLVWHKTFFCWAASFSGLHRSFPYKSTTCLQMVAFEYFQHDLIFDISE